MVVVGRNATDRYAGIAREELAQDRVGRNRRLHTGLEDRVAALIIGWCGLDVIAQAEVDGQDVRDTPVVLREEAPVPVVGVAIVGRVLAVAFGCPIRKSAIATPVLTKAACAAAVFGTVVLA